ncbi:MAG: SRPBCC domain-containing protein [Sandaracinaceae bacterium]
MIDPSPIVTERTIDAAPVMVWRAISDGDVMPRWFFEPIEEFRPEVGFETRFTISVAKQDFVHVWRVTEAEPERRLSYTYDFAGYDGHALVTWELEPAGAATRVTVTHRGLHTFPSHVDAFSREACAGGWVYFLDRLQAHLEG